MRGRLKSMPPTCVVPTFEGDDNSSSQSADTKQRSRQQSVSRKRSRISFNLVAVFANCPTSRPHRNSLVSMDIASAVNTRSRITTSARWSLPISAPQQEWLATIGFDEAFTASKLVLQPEWGGFGKASM